MLSRILPFLMILLPAAQALAQIIDTGSETAVAAKVVAAPPDRPPAPAASSQEEQLSRTLLQLKSERTDAAAKYAPGDPRLADIDEKLSTLRQQIAGQDRGIFTDEPQQEPVAIPSYPRIVQAGSEYAPAPLSTNTPSQSFTAPAGPMIASNTDSQATTAARQALQQNVTLLADQQPLAAVLENFVNQTRANVYVNWAALQTTGIDRNTPVSLNLNAVSGSRALRTIIDRVSGATVNLSFTVDDGIVTVSTRDDLASAKYQSVRVYNVRDLIAFDSSQYPAQLVGAIHENRANNVMDLIKSVVAPDSWRDNGGTIGSIRELDGLLVVNQIADNHAALEQLLARIRAAR